MHIQMGNTSSMEISNAASKTKYVYWYSGDESDESKNIPQMKWCSKSDDDFLSK